jgi:hypothetical protein
MAPRDGEHCENCLNHLRKRHHDGAQCGKCLPRDGSLQRCKSCKLVRYCVRPPRTRRTEPVRTDWMEWNEQSRECQKAHWKQHKQYCEINVEIKQTREAMGGWIEERQKTFEKWCDKYSQPIASAALSALEVMIDRERTGTYMPILEAPKCFADVEIGRNTLFFSLPQCRRSGIVWSDK